MWVKKGVGQRAFSHDPTIGTLPQQPRKEPVSSKLPRFTPVLRNLGFRCPVTSALSLVWMNNGCGYGVQQWPIQQSYAPWQLGFVIVTAQTSLYTILPDIHCSSPSFTASSRPRYGLNPTSDQDPYLNGSDPLLRA